MSALIWVALDLRQLARTGENVPARLRSAAIGALCVLAVQLLFGAWVAGLNAGQVANDWPTMQGRFFPEGVDWSNGALFALTHDPYLIHFFHRWWAWIVVAVLVIFGRKIRSAPGGRPASIAIHSAFGTQILLGIFTVLSGVAIGLAALHQAVGAGHVGVFGADSGSRQRGVGRAARTQALAFGDLDNEDGHGRQDEASGIVGRPQLQAFTNQRLRTSCCDLRRASRTERLAAGHLLTLQHQHVQAAALDQRTLL